MQHRAKIQLQMPVQCQLQLHLQLHRTTTTKQLQLHYTASNHLSLHQWAASAILASQQLTSPIGFLSVTLPPPPCAALW